MGHSDAGGKTPQELQSTGTSWIDVRDLAEAQALALQTESVANERVIVSAGAAVWQEWRKSCYILDFCIAKTD